MQKKIIALAIAAAFVAPAAFADTGNITVYGKLNADFESVKSDLVKVPGTDATSMTRVSTNASRFGVKGTEDLGDGLKAIYQYEVQVDLNGNAGDGFGNGTRNSQIGIAGGFGTAFFGIWDSPYKLSHNKIELFDNTTFASAGNIIGKSSNGVSFNTRLTNSVNYWSPKMGGFQVKAAYGADHAKTATTDNSMISLSATYEDGMFYAAYAFQSLNDKAAKAVAATGDKTDGSRLVGALKFEGGQIGLAYESLKSKVALTGISSTRNAWELAGQYKIGASNLGLSYAVAGNEGAVVAGADNGAKQLSLRYGYNFSKRSELYVMYSSLTNDVKGAYKFYPTAAAGSKQTGMGLGMIHSF